MFFVGICRLLRYKKTRKAWNLQQVSSDKFCEALLLENPYLPWSLPYIYKQDFIGKPIVRLDRSWNTQLTGCDGSIRDLQKQLEESSSATRWSPTVRVTNSVFLDRCVCLFVGWVLHLSWFQGFKIDTVDGSTCFFLNVQMWTFIANSKEWTWLSRLVLASQNWEHDFWTSQFGGQVTWVLHCWIDLGGLSTARNKIL